MAAIVLLALAIMAFISGAWFLGLALLFLAGVSLDS